MLATILFSLLSSCLLSKNLKIKIYKTIILPNVSYRCETWSLTLREEYRLRVFDNRVLRRTYGSKREEVAGGWRRLHSEELHNLFVSPNVITVIKSRRMRWVGHAAQMEEMRNACNSFVRRPEEKGPHARLRHRWDDHVRMDLRVTGREVVDWMHPAQDRDQQQAPVNTVKHLQLP
jgi:hypothetical protein